METQKPEAFKNNSCFQGIYQYFDTYGNEWRVQQDGVACHFYEDVGNAFRFSCAIYLKKNGKIRDLKKFHEKIERVLEAREYQALSA